MPRQARGGLDIGEVALSNYVALIRRPADGIEWQVTFPDLPDCQTSGSTQSQAAENARLALATHLAILAVAGEAMPEPRSPADILLDANEDSELARQMVGAVLRAIDPDSTTVLRETAIGARRQFGFYGDRQTQRNA
jgi:predicted RNase H-like HicB family nuclease